MAGLDKILNQIIADAEQSAANRLEAARKEAEQILSEAKQACQKMDEDAQKEEAEAKVFHEGRIQSSVEQQRRRIMLRTKQELIQELIEETYERLRSQTTETYFDTLEKLIETYAWPEEGEIYFSREDLLRMPEGFDERINAAADKRGGRLKRMNEPRPILDGFILVYGGIEENCTLKALIESKKDILLDQINRIVFA
ncbi:MAG: hypothetical protein IIX57_06100 [Lachnospiraceae bacterium]|nr:hypothetical protein [Lachnospiraceae bacterium]